MVLVKSEFCNDAAAVSPGGGRMAYESTVSGRYEIYVERYPELGRRQQISTSAPAPGGRPYDIAPDGRFLIIRSGQAEAAGGTAPSLVLALNWFEELKRLVPVN